MQTAIHWSAWGQNCGTPKYDMANKAARAVGTIMWYHGWRWSGMDSCFLVPISGVFHFGQFVNFVPGEFVLDAATSHSNLKAKMALESACHLGRCFWCRKAA
jgi:hypothetical protein